MSNERFRIEDRLKFLQTVSTLPEGLVPQLGLRLPIVIAGGDRWMNLYYLLTGCHALHVLAGLLAMAWLLTRRLTRADVVITGNVAWYWQLVDAVWIALFVLLYF